MMAGLARRDDLVRKVQMTRHRFAIRHPVDLKPAAAVERDANVRQRGYSLVRTMVKAARHVYAIISIPARSPLKRVTLDRWRSMGRGRNGQCCPRVAGRSWFL